MIRMNIDEDFFIELCIDRLKEYWTQDDDVAELYRIYIHVLAYDGCLDGIYADIMTFVDNLYINDTKVMDKEELEYSNINEYDTDRILAKYNSIYLVRAY